MLPIGAFDPLRPPPLLGTLGTLDHYTICVEDAAASAAFHCDVLGFRFLRTQHINWGTVGPGEIDMLNFIIGLPGDDHRVCVITEGLNDRTVFRRFVRTHGPGVHHIAYAVPDLEQIFELLRSRGYRFTSDQLLIDRLTGLRQVFLSKEYTGYYVELIDRTTDRRPAGELTDDNMRGLVTAVDHELDLGPARD